MACSRAAAGGLPDLGIPASRWTGSAVSGNSGRTSARHRSLGRGVTGRNGPGKRLEEELELWLDRARAYAARIGWLMAVA